MGELAILNKNEAAVASSALRVLLFSISLSDGLFSLLEVS